MIKFLEQNRKFAVVFSILIAIEIFLVSSIPGSGISSGGMDLSVAYHSIVFFLLNFFLLISLNGQKEMRIRRLLLALLISLIYAILDEIHQIFIPLRSADIKDILVDSAGILISTITYFYSKNKTIKSDKKIL